jgi:adenylate kinase family enzyme
MHQWNEMLMEVEQALAEDKASQLALLAQTFGLNQQEKDVLQACMALHLDPNLGRVYAYLQDHSGRNYVTAPLVARLFGHGLYLPLSTASPLVSWGLVREMDMAHGEPARLDCDPFIRNWLLGRMDLDEALTGIAQVQPCHQPLSRWPVNETLGFIAKMLKSEHQHTIRIFVSGTEGSGRRSFAAAVCRKLGLLLLSVAVDCIADANWPQTYKLAQRQAYLDGCVLLWHGSALFERPWPRNIPSLQLQFIIGEPHQHLKQEEGMTDYRVELPDIHVDECIFLWQQLVPSAALWPGKELEQMVRRQQVTIGQIVTAAKKEVTSVIQASEIVRFTSRQRLDKLAQQMSSSFGWDDLFVPDWLKQNLSDFTYEATERHQLWTDPEVMRLFPQGRGLVALFTGSPGTGKTMAAQVIANQLQLDLFRVDLSAIVSKYVGETSKNMERILSSAQSMDVVLLFDEADALFGKRTEIKDAHDRFANTDTNYLLQAIEQYPGIAILASNRKANIDGGFLRRLRYVLEFPKPDGALRLQMWRNMMTTLAGQETATVLDKELMQLASMLELTGAQIKQSILSALFMARKDGTKITIAHLLRGLERELMKEGRGLGQAQELLKR